MRRTWNIVGEKSQYVWIDTSANNSNEKFIINVEIFLQHNIDYYRKIEDKIHEKKKKNILRVKRALTWSGGSFQLCPCARRLYRRRPRWQTSWVPPPVRRRPGLISS